MNKDNQNEDLKDLGSFFLTNDQNIEINLENEVRRSKKIRKAT